MRSGVSLRAVAKEVGRSASTLSREVARDADLRPWWSRPRRLWSTATLADAVDEFNWPDEVNGAWSGRP